MAVQDEGNIESGQHNSHHQRHCSMPLLKTEPDHRNVIPSEQPVVHNEQCPHGVGQLLKCTDAPSQHPALWVQVATTAASWQWCILEQCVQTPGVSGSLQQSSRLYLQHQSTFNLASSAV